MSWAFTMRAREVNRRIERLGGRVVRQVGSHRRYVVSYSVREAVVLAADMPDHALQLLNLAYEWHTGDPTVDQAANEVRALRARSRGLERDADERAARVARKLLAVGWSVRDIAAFLDISAQRVLQMTHSMRRVV